MPIPPSALPAFSPPRKCHHQGDESPGECARRFCASHLARIEDALGYGASVAGSDAGDEAEEDRGELRRSPWGVSTDLEEACTKLVVATIKAVLLDLRSLVRLLRGGGRGRGGERRGHEGG